MTVITCAMHITTVYCSARSTVQYVTKLVTNVGYSKQITEISTKYPVCKIILFIHKHGELAQSQFTDDTIAFLQMLRRHTSVM